MRFTQPDLFHFTPDADELEQYFTPSWAATALLLHYFPDLTDEDFVLEPSCGTGVWLQALEDLNSQIRAIGFEIDPVIAERARQHTTHPIVTGDFLAMPLDITPTCAIGNLPWSAATVDAFLQRLYEILPDNGRCGFLLPAHYFSLPKRVLHLQEHWSVKADHVPRYIYPELRYAMTFAYFVKDYRRRLVGFSLYAELEALKSLKPEFRLIATQTRKPWAREMARRALENLGGTGSLQEIYREVEIAGVPTDSPHWRDRLRESCGRNFPRVRDGVFSLQAAA